MLAIAYSTGLYSMENGNTLHVLTFSCPLGRYCRFPMFQIKPALRYFSFRALSHSLGSWKLLRHDAFLIRLGSANVYKDA